MQNTPSFLITIDTEGDNLWGFPQEITTKNSQFLPRFQNLCEKYGFKPTYLTNYEMAMCPMFQEFVKDTLQRQQCEIGMHLHAWNSPPIYSLTSNDYQYCPYLVEYPQEVMEKKVKFMTDLLESTFERKMTSHRAGRWAFNEIYAKILEKLGYLVDCSCTPYISWKSHLGNPNGSGGTDYSLYPVHHYFLDLNNLSQKGYSSLMEIPMTIIPHFLNHSIYKKLFKTYLLKRVVRKFFNPIWLRPNGKNKQQILNLIQKNIDKKSPYIQFMLHSSELMPGGSPNFPNHKSIENLYDNLDIVFEKISNFYQGHTLTEYYHLWKF